MSTKAAGIPLRSALRLPQVQQALQQDIAALPLPHPRMSVHEHHRLVSKLFRRMWVRHSEIPRTVPRKSWVSPKVWQQLCGLAEVRNQSARCKRQLAQVVKRTWFLALFAQVLPMMRKPRGMCGGLERSETLREGREARALCHMLNLQVALHSALLTAIDRSTRNSCRQAFLVWAAAKTEGIAAQADAGDITAVWHLARLLRLTKRRLRLAYAPVQDEQGRTTTDHSQLTALWMQQLTEEFSGQVARVSSEGLQQLLVERRAQSIQFDTVVTDGASTANSQSALPVVIEEWYDFVTARLQKFKRGKQVGSDRTPNELYAASGEPGILQLAVLLQKVQKQGPPQCW